MKAETWNGHAIRFVEKDGQWYAVAADVYKALDIDNITEALRNMPEDMVAITAVADLSQTEVSSKRKSGHRKTQNMNILSELGVYRLIMRSDKPEAEPFQRWVYDLLKQIREEVLGIKAYEVFRMMDKDHQKEAMRRLNECLPAPEKIDYIKANTIADKAVSTKHGFPKMVKKGAMNAAMLKDRQPVLDDTVQLMAINQRLGLGLSVSEAIYRKHGAGAPTARAEQVGGGAV